MMKTCTKCKVEKSLDCFYKQKSKKDGIRPYCKECGRIYSQKHYVENKEALINKSKIYYQNNKDYYKDYNTIYCQKNKDAIRHQHKEWSKNNKEKVKIYNKTSICKLGDGRIRGSLVNGTLMSAKDIPEELIEVKRLQILIKRLAKEMQK